MMIARAASDFRTVTFDEYELLARHPIYPFVYAEQTFHPATNPEHTLIKNLFFAGLIKVHHPAIPSEIQFTFTERGKQQFQDWANGIDIKPLSGGLYL